LTLRVAGAYCARVIGSRSDAYDVVAVGGRPAGAAAAHLLASWGWSVLLLHHTAGRPALAESLPPSTRKLFALVGQLDAVERAQFHPNTGNVACWANAGRTTVTETPGFHVRRDAFDRVLRGAAASAHAQIVDGVVRRVDPGDPSRVTYASSDGTIRAVTARQVLDCSGRSGVVAARGLRRQHVGYHTLAINAEWESDAWQRDEHERTLVESYADGWAWSVPVTLTRRYVTVMLDPRQSDVPSRDALDRAYRDELARTRLIGELIAGATLAESSWGCDASPYRSQRVSDDGLLLVGDAASFIDPLSSFGVKKALASAWLAAIVVNTSLTDEAMSSAALDLFEERERAMYAELQRQAATLARDASGGHDSAFWQARADEIAPADLELDAALLRGDHRVRDAFEELKRRPAIQLRAGVALRVVERAVVRGNRVLLEEHLASPTIPQGVRYCRNVDLVAVTRLAPHYDQVPDLYDAYSRTVSSMPLPDFLGALSALIGLEMLTLA